MDKEFKILVVDDDVNLASNLHDILQTEGYSVSAAPGVETALNLCREQVFDLALIDMRLPGISGVELTEKITGLIGGVEYIITGYALLDSTINAVNQKNIVGYVTKPINMGHLLTTVKQVFERRQVEKQLAREKEKAKDYLNIAGVMLSVVNADENITMMNKKGCDITGYKGEELIGKNWFNLLIPERMRDEVRTVFRKLMAGEIGPVEYYVNPLVTKEGKERLVAFHNTVIGEPNGQIVGVLISGEDITRQSRMEEELIESEERYRALVDLGAEVGEAIVMLQDGERESAIHIFFNKEWPRITGYSEDELLKMSFFDLVHPKYRKSSLERHQRKISGESVPGLFEMLIIRKDGTEIPVELTSAYTTYLGKRANVAYIRETTERRKMQEQLIITDRLASIGELASGIAHELNNPLTSIIGLSDLLLGKYIPDDIKEDLEVINAEAKRTAKVVKNLLTFARRHETKKSPTDVNGAIKVVLALRAYEQKVSNIQIKTHFASDLPEIMADTFQLQQVFLNIVINAEYFMIEAHKGGTLTITTERAGDIIRASLADDGPGITEENLKHIFDPFFTTKEIGKGTGLGLSICHGIITEHGGRIYAESEVGKGATFVIELPIR